MHRVVIVGAGLAGLRAAQRLRERAFDGTVTIVGDEPHLPYHRPPLATPVLGGEPTVDDCAFDCDDADAVWELGNAAVALDQAHHLVKLTDGELPYDALVIATGRRARDWPTPLPPLRGFYTLRGLDDTLALHSAITPDSRVVIVGGGFIGCEVAATLHQRGVTDVTIVETAPYLLPALGPLVGRFATELHREKGVAVECSVGVARFHGAEQVEAVELTDGRLLPADIVLLALGSVPNTDWLEGAELTLSDGTVACDQYCFASSHPDIIAVGDVATWTHVGIGRPVRVEHWTNAAEMARAAVDNLLDGPEDAKPFAPVPTFWSDQYDLKLKAAGFMALADDYRVIDQDPNSNSLVVEAFAGGRLIGAISCNNPKAHLAYRQKLKPLLVGTAV